MSLPTRQIAKGSRLYIARASAPSTFARVAGVVSISGPNRGRADVDATELDTSPDTLPGGAVEEQYWHKLMVPGTKECAPISVQLNMNHTQYATLTTVYEKDEICNYKITFKGSSNTVTWSGYIKDLPLDLTGDQLAKCEVTFQPEDTPTYNVV